MPLTDFFLEYIPGYNKFRTVSTTLVILELLIPFLGILALNKIIKEGKKLAILNFGARLHETLKAAENLIKKGVNITVVDSRFAKPLDENLIWQIATEHEVLITIEEGSIGGFGSHVSQFLSEKNLLDSNLKFRSMILPDRFIDHDKPELMYKNANLDSIGIENKILDTLNSKVLIKKSN